MKIKVKSEEADDDGLLIGIRFHKYGGRHVQYWGGGRMWYYYLDFIFFGEQLSICFDFSTKNDT